jgi:hypothetical protein
MDAWQDSETHRASGIESEAKESGGKPRCHHEVLASRGWPLAKMFRVSNTNEAIAAVANTSKTQAVAAAIGLGLSIEKLSAAIAAAAKGKLVAHHVIRNRVLGVLRSSRRRTKSMKIAKTNNACAKRSFALVMVLYAV